MSEYNLVGIDGNAFSVMGYVIKSMKNESKSKDDIDTYKNTAMSGDYNNLLNTSRIIIDELNKKIV